MTQLILKCACLLALACALGLPSGAQAGVWDEAKAASNNVSGKITQVSDDGQSVRVTVEVADNSTETLEVCRSHSGGDINNKAETALVASAKAAVESGAKATLVYEGPFNRCVSAIAP